VTGAVRRFIPKAHVEARDQAVAALRAILDAHYAMESAIDQAEVAVARVDATALQVVPGDAA
jgi:hypothetical protein